MGMLFIIIIIIIIIIIVVVVVVRKSPSGELSHMFSPSRLFHPLLLTLPLPMILILWP